MILDLPKAKFCTGYGDLCVWAWLATANDLKFYAPLQGGQKQGDHFPPSEKGKFLEMLGCEVLTEPQSSMVDPSGGYRQEIRHQCKESRHLYWAKYLGLKPDLIRPEVTISKEGKDWGSNHRADVLLFPQCCFATRTWLPGYWVDLAWKFHKAGFSTAVLMANKQNNLCNVPKYYFGFAWDHVAALIQNARIVIANDSGPAHLAGTLNAKTYAITGATSPRVFDYVSDSVTTISTDKLPCVGCHFASAKGYRAACDSTCQALALTTPDDVFKKIKEEL